MDESSRVVVSRPACNARTRTRNYASFCIRNKNRKIGTKTVF